jgi:acetoin utilization deacetylase AcuC-like enzyme
MTVTTLYVSHPSALDHAMPEGHPERADRIRAVERALEDERFAGLVRGQAPRAETSVPTLVHPVPYVQAIIEASPTEGYVQIDGDTLLSPGTVEAALRGVGGAVHAVDAVMAGECANAFVAMRPPGHHAERMTAMGFCVFNNAAIAARHAREAHGASRVAIVDWDVHHGNGTQDIFWDDRSVMYASTHEMPLFPGTGAASERGNHDTIVNVPLRAGDDGPVFREAFEAGILRRLDAYAPDLIIISAGFDAHHLDPLGHVELTEADFGWATRRLMALADRHAGGRVVSVLEGGYSLKGLGLSVAAHVDALMGR